MLVEEAKGGIRFFSSRALSGNQGLCHGFLARRGGVSPPPYDSLNLDERGEDLARNVERNRAAIAGSFDLSIGNLVTLNQVHGSTVVVVDEGYMKGMRGGRSEADAVITGLAQIPIGILTADCVPILIYDRARRVLAAVHAGWRGTLAMVAVKAVEAMRSGFGCSPGDMTAVIGPHIGPCCYTVKEDVRGIFRGTFGEKADGFFVEHGDLRLDLGMANEEALLQAGLSIADISVKAPCTSCNPSLFFSYRRDGGRTGRQLSFIMNRG